MNKHVPFFIVTASLIAVIAILSFSFFEIAPWKKPVRPSLPARSNDFLALERWLDMTGHPVRTETSPGSYTIPRAGEGTVYVQASLFRWSAENYETLKPWVEKGGRLLVSLDREWTREYSEGMDRLLRDLGIGGAQIFGPTDAEEAGPETQSGGAGGAAPAQEDGAGQESDGQPSTPCFDYRITFDPKELPPEYAAERDSRNIIRLVSVKMGKGSVTIFGSPVFMTNFNLRNTPNARLAWRLTGAADSGGKGVLFIRGRKPAPGFWSRLAGSGELLPFIVSLAAVLVIGFWMIVPVFGRLVEAPVLPGKPIGKRFLAEACFLRRYGALDSYLEPYREIIRQRLEKTIAADAGKSGADYCRRLAEICRIDHTELDKLFKPPRPGSLRPKDFVRAMETVQTILERL